MKYVSGDKQMIVNLNIRQKRTVARTGIAVERTCVDVANHAKAGHDSNMAHASKRYQNRTSNLTNSITFELIEASLVRVHGIVPVGMEYAATVEFGNTAGVNILTGGKNKPYPFLTPALLVNMVVFQERLRKILK